MTAAAAPRPEIHVRPMDVASELPYVHATSADAIIQTHGGRFARKDLLRGLVRELVERSACEVATFPNDPEVILGFALWAPERLLELVYLRKSLAAAPADGAALEAMPIATDVLRALLGTTRLVRMRRIPPQGWAWRTLHAAGFVPMVMPEGI